MALTATAAPPVRDDVVARLGLRDPEVVIAGFDRPNLHLGVRVHLGGDRRAAEVVERVVELAAAGDGRGLVYRATRRTTEDFAAALAARGVGAAAHHGGLGRAARDDVHRRFHDGEVPVVVATSAFGMGIGRPDVRFVVHAASPPRSTSTTSRRGGAGATASPPSSSCTTTTATWTCSASSPPAAPGPTRWRRPSARSPASRAPASRCGRPAACRPSGWRRR